MPLRGADTLGRRLLVNLATQVLLISAVAVASVYAVRYVFGEILMRQALTLEAEHAIEGLHARPDFVLPQTRNLVAYLGPGPLPAWLEGLAPGFHRRVPEPPGTQTHPVYVADAGDGRRLYLVFRAEAVDRLVLSFALIPLAAVLLALYSMAYLSYAYARRGISPVVALAQRVARLDPGEVAGDLGRDLPGTEVAVLARALDDYAARIGALVERERRFTADASHELRTAVTIIGNSAELMAEDPALTPATRARVQTIRAAARDLGEVLSLLLLLAREPGTRAAAGPPEAGQCEAGAVAAHEADRYRSLLDGRPVVLEVHRQAQLPLSAPAQAVGIVLGNLIRNACAYTPAGHITVTVLEHTVSVADTGPGIPDADIPAALGGHYRPRGGSGAGSGLGLSIVQRVCEHYGWALHLGSAPGGGLVASVRFIR